MIVQSFRSVMWVGAVAGAALSCYMVSLRVASERAALERVESRILVAKRDIRALDTELVTRGRIRQLERWNVDVLALSAPTERQFLSGEVQLASLATPTPDGAQDAVMLALAPRAKPAEAKTILAAAARRAPIRTATQAPANPLLVLASAARTVPERPASGRRLDDDFSAEIGRAAAREGAAAMGAQAKSEL